MSQSEQLELIPELPPLVKCPRCRGNAHKSPLGHHTYKCRRCRITFEYVSQAEPRKRGAK